MRWISLFYLCVITTLTASIWLRSGFSITDDGFLLTYQQMFLRGSELYKAEGVWLTDAVGAAWLWLTGDPGLLTARAGGMVLDILTVCCVHFTLTRFYSFWASALALTFVIGLYANGGVIGYIGLSTLFTIAAVACFLNFRWISTSTKDYILAALGGVMVILAVFAKVSMLLALILPLVFILNRIWFHQLTKNKCYKFSFAAYAGVVFCLLAGFGYLSAKGKLPDYLSLFTGQSQFASDEFHTVAGLLRAYLLQAPDFMLWSLFWVGVGLSAYRLFSFGARGGHYHSSLAIRSVLPFLMFFLAATSLFVLHGAKGVLTGYKIALPALSFSWCLLALFAERYYMSERERSVIHADLLGMSILVPVMLAAGSATGVWTMQAGAWLALPVALLSYPRVCESFANSEKGLNYEKITQRVKRFAIICLIVLTPLVIGLKGYSPYQDARRPSSRSRVFQHDRLRGIKSNINRVDSVEELMKVLDSLLVPGQKVIMYNNIPMLHYLTSTEPALGHPWPWFLNKNILTARLDVLKTTASLPRIAVRGLVDMRDRDWAIHSKLNHDLTGNIELIDNFLQDAGYRSMWSNEEFKVLILPSFQ